MPGSTSRIIFLAMVGSLYLQRQTALAQLELLGL